MDLIREILLQLEAAPRSTGWAKVNIEGHSSEEVSYHIKLLEEAGYIEAVSFSAGQETIWRAVCLTWDGHEFLEAAKNLTIWNRAKALMLEKSGGLAVEVMKQLLISIIKGSFGL